VRAALAFTVATTALVAACGANLMPDHGVPVGPPLAPADRLMIVAHLDDDMIFMQPELVEALSHGSVTTVYVLSGDPAHGARGADHTFAAARTAYEHAAGADDWDCGYITIAELPARHCRLTTRPVSMLTIGVPDGGRRDERQDSLLHLVEGVVPTLSLQGPIHGKITRDRLIDELSEIITATAPRELHTLDIAATHGDDHPGHMVTASFALWAAAKAAFTGPIVSHRGYNVEREPISLSDADYARAKPMVGYFEACYRKCGPCGSECPTLDPAHDIWLRRQYATHTVATAQGRLAVPGVSDSCLALSGTRRLGLAGCATGDVVELLADHHLHVGELCAASSPANDDPVILVACSDDPAQYWRLDDEGMVANGRPPVPTADMYFDHMRCLHPTAGSPICGSQLQPRWQLVP
jgi:GlcNAc-PI de-N-acetylase